MKNQLRIGRSGLAAQITAHFARNFYNGGIYHYQQAVIPRFFWYLTFVKQRHVGGGGIFDTFLTRIAFM
ncbi:hypothetical protein AAE045_08455 [Dryocola clanedunensis]